MQEIDGSPHHTHDSTLHSTPHTAHRERLKSPRSKARTQAGAFGAGAPRWWRRRRGRLLPQRPDRPVRDGPPTRRSTARLRTQRPDLSSTHRSLVSATMALEMMRQRDDGTSAIGGVRVKRRFKPSEEGEPQCLWLACCYCIVCVT